MQHRILSTRVGNEQSLVLVRDRARQIGELFGLDELQRTRLSTAVSEVARNAIAYAKGGTIEFLLDDDAPANGHGNGQSVVVRVTDQGPGITRLDEILHGDYRPRGRRAAFGLRGARRLADNFDIATSSAGTTVTLAMRAPRGVPPVARARIGALVEQLARRRMQSPLEELEQRNREMLQTLEVLRQRQNELEAADERKDEFLAMLAHELRNPLAAIRNTLEFLRLREQPTPIELGNALDVIGRQSGQLMRLVDDLMDVSRVTRGKIELKFELQPVERVIRRAVETAKAALDERRHGLVFELPAEALWINIDPVRIEQVLGNLLHNAARYTPPGGRIVVRALRQDERVRIDISDNGSGIDQALLPRVFDLFVQGTTGLSRHNGGLGVGLTLVRRLVEAHDGSVQAASKGPGHGSTFSVLLPACAAPPPTAPAPEAAAAKASSRRVLLIDDNEDNVHTLAAVFRAAGHQVTVAHDGRAGVSMARQFLPQLILVDIGLPEMDGFEVGRILRAEAGLGRPYMATLSGYGAEAMRHRALAAGYDEHLAKPVEITTVLGLLQRLPG